MNKGEKMTYDDLKEHINAIAKYCDSVKCYGCIFGYDHGFYCVLRDVFPGLWEERFMEVKGNDSQ